MREIKFRVFIDEEMVYLPFAGLQYYDFEGSYALSFAVDGYSRFYAHEMYEGISEKIKDSPIMQFTGLHDKNGVEIYEGDILQETALRGNRYKVFAVDGGFAINTHQDDLGKQRVLFYESLADMQIASYIGGCVEVIGNIHQHPELLNTK
jgi:uncharacterized phage protein (TIGR01671 family)